MPTLMRLLVMARLWRHSCPLEHPYRQGIEPSLNLSVSGVEGGVWLPGSQWAEPGLAVMRKESAGL